MGSPVEHMQPEEQRYHRRRAERQPARQRGPPGQPSPALRLTSTGGSKRSEPSQQPGPASTMELRVLAKRLAAVVQQPQLSEA